MKLSVTAFHSNLFPTIFVEEFDEGPDFHPTFLARFSPTDCKHSPLKDVSKVLNLSL
jgi:hypothetical protein